jgi:hypothetical protein
LTIVSHSTREYPPQLEGDGRPLHGKPSIVPCHCRIILEDATMMMPKFIAWFGFGLPFALAAVGQSVQPKSLALFSQLGLTPQQIAAIDEGRPVAKVLPWGAPSEVYVFGAVHVQGSPATYLKAARDITRLAGTSGYLGIGALPAAATAADLSALTLEADDVKALKNCRESACDAQLPTASIRAFHDAYQLVSAGRVRPGQRPRPSDGHRLDS